MTWFKVDDKSPFHRKVLKAGNEAWGAFCRAGAVCSGEGTDGVFTAETAAAIAPPKVWSRLIDCGLVERVPGGTDLRLHDFLVYNPSAAAVSAKREARARAGAEGGRRSAAVRGKGEAQAEAIASPERSNCLAVASRAFQPPTRPDPRREDLTEPTPPQLSSENPGPPAAGVSPGIATEPPSVPVAAPEEAPPTWTPDLATKAVLEALAGSRKLRGVANPEYALRLARHCREHGHTGSKSLDAVLEALREADDKVDALEAGGDHVSSVAAFVLGCVRSSARTPRRSRASPGHQPASDRWAPKILDAETIATLPLLAADDPLRF